MKDYSLLKRGIAAFAAFVVAFIVCISGVMSGADKYIEDILYHHPGAADSHIRIIRIDDRSMNALGDFSDWDRSVYARLVDTLSADDSKPAVIGFDILFGGDGSDQASRDFADSCAKAGNVVCAFSYVFSREPVSDSNGKLIGDRLAVQDKTLPFPALRENTTQGFANALMDSRDGVIRSAFLWFDENGERVPSLSAEIYRRYTGQDITGGDSIYQFRYSAGVSEYENVSLIDVLDGTVPPQVFKDCIVLVGAYAAGMMDAYYVPVDRSQQMFGVEIHANVIQALMQGKSLQSVPRWLDALCTALLTGLLVFFCSRFGVIKAVLVCVITAFARLGAGAVLFSQGFSGEVLELPIIAVLVAVWFTGMHYYRANSAKRHIERAFSKYVAPQVVKEIAGSGNYELKLGGENRDIAVLFVDIRGFTPLSESLEPEQVVDILNSYLELTTNCIFRHGGTLDKFIGDATMAVFNAPFDTEDYVYKAVLTALDIVAGGERIEEQFISRYGKHVGFGVGVNCGPAVVGNIGCDFRMDYTAIGDTVNTAARLEDNAPRGTVYISGSVYERLKGRIKAEPVGEIPLKGKSRSVMVYSVTGTEENYEAAACDTSAE